MYITKNINLLSKYPFFAITARYNVTEVRMEKILPGIIVCGVGIALCLAYIVAVSIKAIRRSPRKREFEIEEDTLIIKLGKRKKK